MTREERVQELTNLIGEEDTKIKNQILAVIQPHISMNVGIGMNRSAHDKKLYYALYINDENNEKVFATGVDVCFNRRYSWNGLERVDNLDSYKMSVDYGTCGSHTAYNDKGAIKQSDIMIGKIWEYEEELTQIYNEIDWTYLQELENITHEIYEEKSAKRRAEAEEARRLEELKLNTILDFLYEGNVIKDLDNEWNKFAIRKVGRKNITLDRKIYFKGKWRDYIDKFDLARYILNGNYNYKED